MSRLALLVALIVAGLATVVALYATAKLTASPDCLTAAQTAEISQRAAQICTAELVGCTLSLDEIKQIIVEQEAAKACR